MGNSLWCALSLMISCTSAKEKVDVQPDFKLTSYDTSAWDWYSFAGNFRFQAPIGTRIQIENLSVFYNVYNSDPYLPNAVNLKITMNADLQCEQFDKQNQQQKLSLIHQNEDLYIYSLAARDFPEKSDMKSDGGIREFHAKYIVFIREDRSCALASFDYFYQQANKSTQFDLYKDNNRVQLMPAILNSFVATVECEEERLYLLQNELITEQQYKEVFYYNIIPIPEQEKRAEFKDEQVFQFSEKVANAAYQGDAVTCIDYLATVIELGK